MSVALFDGLVKFFQGVDVGICVDFVVELSLPMSWIASALWGVDFGTRERGLVLKFNAFMMATQRVIHLIKVQAS